MNCRTIPITALIGLGVFTLISPNPGWAQKPVPLAKPNPLAPTLNTIFPAGMQRGKSFTLTLTGAQLKDATKLLVDFPAKITLLSDKANKAGTSLPVKIDVPADAPVGPFAVRIATKHGISNPRLLCIDDLPQTIEISGNNQKEKAQLLKLPCVVSGRIDNQSSDYYRIAAKKGDLLSFDLIGRRLGNVSDPQLTIYSADSFRELVHVNDSPGCQTDPRVTFTVPKDGEYLIAIRDLLYRGGADYVYQLRIGDFPCVTTPIPMAAQRGSKLVIDFAGPYLKNVKPISNTFPKDSAIHTIELNAVNNKGLHSWPVSLKMSDHPETVEKEPNDQPAEANTVALQSGVTGRFLTQSDKDHYRFSAKKGQKIRIQAHTLELNSPTLVYMQLLDGKTNKVLAKTNPQAAPPADQRIDFTVPADADYIVDVQHLNYVGGPDQVYRLTLAAIQPDFELSYNLDRFDVANGGLVPLKISVNRNVYNGPIRLQLQNAGILTGEGSVAAGQKEGVIVVRCPKQAALGAQFITVAGEATVDGQPIYRIADAREAVSQGLADLPFPPQSLLYRAALAIRTPGPFQLTAKLKTDKHYRGSTAILTVTAMREKGFTDAITLSEVVGLPADIKTPKKLPAIAKGKSEISINLTLTPKTPMGIFPLILAGQGKVGKAVHTEYSTATTLFVERPFALKLASTTLNLKQGAKATLKVDIIRKAGYAGPISLELRKLPANVSAKKIVVAAGKSTAEIEVVAAANAAVGEKKDVDVLGIATGAGNQPVGSGPLTVKVAAN